TNVCPTVPCFSRSSPRSGRVRSDHRPCGGLGHRWPDHLWPGRQLPAEQTRRLRLTTTASPREETSPQSHTGGGFLRPRLRLHGGLPSADLDYILEDLPALTTESIASANRIAEIVRSVALFARDDAQRLGPVNVEDALEAAITLTWHELKQRAALERNYGGVPTVFGS